MSAGRARRSDDTASSDPRAANPLAGLALTTVDQADRWLDGVAARLDEFEQLYGTEIRADYTLDSLRRLGHWLLERIDGREAIAADPGLDAVIDRSATYVAETVVRRNSNFVHAVDHKLIDANGWTLPQVRDQDDTVLVPTTIITKAVIVRDPDFLYEHVGKLVPAGTTSAPVLAEPAVQIGYRALVLVGGEAAEEQSTAEELEKRIGVRPTTTNGVHEVVLTDGWRLMVRNLDPAATEMSEPIAAATRSEALIGAAPNPVTGAYEVLGAIDPEMDHFNDYLAGVEAVAAAHAESAFVDTGPL